MKLSKKLMNSCTIFLVWPLELVWLRCGEKVLQREASVWTSITTFSHLHNFDEDKDFDIHCTFSYLFHQFCYQLIIPLPLYFFTGFSKKMFPILGATALTASNKRFCWKVWNKVWQWSFISYTVFSIKELLVGVFKTSQRATWLNRSKDSTFSSTFSWCLPNIAENSSKIEAKILLLGFPNHFGLLSSKPLPLY